MAKLLGGSASGCRETRGAAGGLPQIGLMLLGIFEDFGWFFIPGRIEEGSTGAGQPPILKYWFRDSYINQNQATGATGNKR